MLKWGLFILVILAATLCAATPLFADDSCGGDALFSTMFFVGNCYNTPAEGTCDNSEFCSDSASFADKSVSELLANCTTFTGSFMIEAIGEYIVYPEPDCAGEPTTTTPSTLCRPFFLCGARTVNLSEFFDGESGSTTGGSSSSSAAETNAVWM